MTATWRWYLLAGALATVVCWLLPLGIGTDAAYSVIGASGAAAVIVGVRRYRPAHPVAWYLIAAGIAASVAGDTLFAWYQDIASITPFPSPADALYLAAYPLLAAGLLVLVRSRDRERGSNALSDTAILTVGLGLLSWVFLIGPIWSAEGEPLVSRLVGVAYPFCDVLLFAMMVRLATATAKWNPASRLLAGAGGALLVADALFAAEGFSTAISDYQSMLDITWLLAYLLWGAAALHPSMHALSAPAPRRTVSTSTGRLAALAAAVLIGPGLIGGEVLAGAPLSVGPVAVESTAMVLLVLARVRDLVKQLADSGLYDALTGLPNRRLFLDRLERSLALWHRSATPFAVLFVDLDGFKAVNDTFGHQMGDRVLTEAGARIAHALRTVDTGARFGGDEFAILLHDVEPADVMPVVQRVQAGFAQPRVLDGHEIAIRASLGVATAAVGYTCAEDVLRDADAAMYRAKGAERGSVEFFDDAMHAHTIAQRRLRCEVERALEARELEMHYQPIVNLTTGRTDRFEAVVRWNHPVRGLLPPDEFLPLLDDVALTIRLGHWTIDEVCRQLAAWGPAVLGVAVSVSGREFWQRGLLSGLQRHLDHHHVTADRLTLEIAEDVIMRSPEAALRLMNEMHDAGLRLHIDDFGAGGSSLATLHRFPVDAFKIDRSLIRDLATDSHCAELVSALVAMGSALGLDVVADGVETEHQIARLQEIGGATGQGLLFTPAANGDRALVGGTAR